MKQVLEQMSNLKIIRILSGLTRVDMADKAGCSASKVADIEQGRRKPRPGVMATFAESLGVDENILSEDISIIPVPKSWKDVYTDFRKRVLIDEINALSPKDLSSRFHYVYEKMVGKNKVVA